jgi:hypothetical protein
MFKTIQKASTTLLAVAVLAIAALGQAAPASSATASTTTPAAPSAQAVTPLFQYGFDERVRVEHWNNPYDFSSTKDDERLQYRFRTRMWFQVPLGTPDAEIYVRVANEFKRQTVPDIKFNNDEVFFDNLYLNLKKTFIPGLSLRVGRQDIQRGEGLIISDASAVDGSRSNYFNAAVFAYSWKKSKVELMGILDPRQDRFLPIGHNQHKYLNEWNEQAVGLYYTGRDAKKTDVDAYYFYKKEVGDYRAATNVQFMPDRYIHTLGARAVQRLDHELSVTGELAGQWGAQHANVVTGAPKADIRAWAGYAYVKKGLNTKRKAYVLGGYRVMSGDDPATAGTVEGWDPVFGRYPKYSDLYMYSMTSEKGIAYWTNMGMWQAEAGITPIKPLSLRATFYSDSAFHPYTKGSTSIFSTGTHRGENMVLRADYTLNKNVSGHIQYDKFLPGDFYVNNAATAHFFRAEILYSFKGAVGVLDKK